MNLACWMILRHIEAVTVDERGFDERADCFSETESHKLPLHHSQESQVGMILAGSSSRIRSSFFKRARISSSSSIGASLRTTITRSSPDFSMVPHFFRLIHPVAIEPYFSANFAC